VGESYTETVQAANSSARILRFGAFELDVQNGELRRAGVLIKVSPQQLQVLQLLAENAGQVLTRDEMQREVWGTDVFVDFDRNLNVCVAQIRAALNDDSDAPRFIQTIPKRGYKFIAPVERVGGALKDLPMPPALTPARSRSFWIVRSAIALLAGCAAAALFFYWRQPAPPQRVIVAALPFENLSGDSKEAVFADGLTEELIGQLGSLNPDRLGVIGRSSVMRFKGAAHGIDQIGRELHADYVIEGTVRRSEGRVRIAARLVKVADQAQVWNDTSERNESEMFRLEEESAARIASAVIEKLLSGAQAYTARGHASNQEAYEAYLNGRYLQHNRNRADLARSIGYFEQAVRLDPQFDLAYSAAAQTYVMLGRSGTPPQEVFPKARAAAEKALAINEANAEAHNGLANAFFWSEWNWKEAERHFARAVALNPSFSLAHHDYAFFLVAMGRTEQGLTSLRRSIAADPLSTHINMDAGWLYLQAHRFEDAIRQARRALELEPGIAEANACIVRALIDQKKYGEALEAVPGWRGNAGNPLEALKQSYRLKVQDAEKSGKGDPFSLAMLYAFLGDNSKALDSLEQAYARRSVMMPMLKTEPAFAALHSEPRFQELVRKLALP
jgi:TolB-like protein/DNA-binding winged helix-turn-helix (wHTH) protein/Tfp pilus assembly protein PilF